ncbi:MAG: DUF4861 family protein [Prolixibacteraceae bacterium]|nr:DUF4861 family protein [Prolixibacteraceae bacterium]
MKNLPVALVLLLLLSCQSQTKLFTLVLENNNEQTIEIENIAQNELLKHCITEPFAVTQNNSEIPAQVIISPENGNHSLLFLPKASKKSRVKIFTGRVPAAYAPLTHAELWHKTGGQFVDSKYVGGGDFVEVNSVRVPDECTDHSFYIKYEGPGWESNLVGYRFYLDWRNAVDVFGKTTNEMILDGVGQDGYDSYHEMQPWGMDVLKVGSTLGVGTIAWWNGQAIERVAETDSVTCEILSNGGLRAMIQTNYYGWQTAAFKTNMQSYLSIDANSRLTKQMLVFDAAPENVCTGIYIDQKAEKIELQHGNWTCLATWGQQSLNNNKLGLCVFAKTSNIISLTADKKNHVLVLKTENNMAVWYFGAAWELEPKGIKTKEEFIKYLEDELLRLNKSAALT